MDQVRFHTVAIRKRKIRGKRVLFRNHCGHSMQANVISQQYNTTEWQCGEACLASGRAQHVNLERSGVWESPLTYEDEVPERVIQKLLKR